MAEQFDVYRDWLGISETARPLNCYQLLRVKLFEDDTAKIRRHYRQMNAHLRKFAAGEHVGQARALLGELLRAMLCLTDIERKREYDASLGRTDGGEGRRRSFEEILIAGKVVDRAQLTKAQDYAESIGLETRDALVQQKMAAADVVMLAYAESLGLPYVELADIGVDEQLVPRVPAALARRHACVPVMIDGDQLLMASPNPLPPDVDEQLRECFGMPVRPVLCTAVSINAVVARYFPREAETKAEKAATKKKAPKQSAPKMKTKGFGSEEEIKRRLMISLIACGLVVILYTLLRWGTYSGRWGDFPSSATAMVGFLVGTVVGGIAFAILTKLNL